MYSHGIPINRTDNARPFVLECFAYFGSIITTDHEPSPPAIKPATAQGSTTSLIPGLGDTNNSSTSPFSLTRGPATRSTPSISYDPKVEQNFNVDDFHFNLTLGLGRAKVCYEDTLNIAIKYADIMKRPEMLAELRNEVAIYNALIDLQGRFIPLIYKVNSFRKSNSLGTGKAFIVLAFHSMERPQKVLMNDKRRF